MTRTSSANSQQAHAREDAWVIFSTFQAKPDMCHTMAEADWSLSFRPFQTRQIWPTLNKNLALKRSRLLTVPRIVERQMLYPSTIFSHQNHYCLSKSSGLAENQQTGDFHNKSSPKLSAGNPGLLKPQRPKCGFLQ